MTIVIQVAGCIGSSPLSRVFGPNVTRTPAPGRVEQAQQAFRRLLFRKFAHPPNPEAIVTLSSPSQLDEMLDVYLSRRHPHSRAIYLCMLILALGGLISLPLVKVDLTTTARGTVRPALERQQIVSPISGRIARMNLEVGRPVRPGDVLVSLESAAVDARIAALRERSQANLIALTDLNHLISTDAELWDVAELWDAAVRAEMDAVVTELNELKREANRFAIEAARASELAASGFLPAQDAEHALEQLLGAEGRIRALIASRLMGWREDQRDLEAAQIDLESSLQTLLDERSRHSILASSFGTIEEIAGLANGAFLLAGDIVAVVSPDSALTAEVFVSPAEIGQLADGQAATLYIDAFDYRVWGGMKGRIERISRDIVVVGETPAFRVDIRLDQAELRSRLGSTADLRKGMSFTAHFAAGRHSLLELLRKGVAEIVDPRWLPAESETLT